MALVKMKDLLLRAQKENKGCGAFSVGNMEMVKGAIQAAEELDIPIILQIAEVRLKYSPLALYGNDDGTGHLCECASSYRGIHLRDGNG